jgi:hypothetical protein
MAEMEEMEEMVGSNDTERYLTIMF